MRVAHWLKSRACKGFHEVCRALQEVKFYWSMLKDLLVAGLRSLPLKAYALSMKARERY
jgi:hypothetical protein